MVEGAGNKCAKFLLIAFNILFVIAAIMLIAVGAVLQYYTAGPSKMGILIIAIGCTSFIVAFFGCCGAIKENRCMLITFAVLLVALLLMCVISAIVGFIFRNEANEVAYDMFLSYIKDYNNSSVVKKLADKFQREQHCCGSYNYTDWRNNIGFNLTNSVPDSCCKNETENCGRNGLRNSTRINEEGCLSYIKEQLEKGYLIMGAVTAAVALIMIMGIILSCCLAKGVGSGYNTM